ncbi:MAG: SDR family oxidoreductase [Burkholderiales bacterium]|nr:SDR family oxidoreductase [Burkholderiales bacterium]
MRRGWPWLPWRTEMRFAGRTAFVCGAASGIGAAVARRLHAEGAQVAAAGLQPDLLAELAASLSPAVLAVECDVTSEASVRAAVGRVVGAWGRIDVLVNAAGVIAADDAASVDDAVWQRTQEVNLGGVMRLMRAVLPGMLARGAGSIVNIASVAAFNASAGAASYAASKAGVVALTRTAASAYGAQGVRVNALAPGWVDTPMSRREMADLAAGLGVDEAEARARTVARVALGRMARPEEIAAACAFLASDEASFVTGAVLVADGGSRIAASARAV